MKTTICLLLLLGAVVASAQQNFIRHYRPNMSAALLASNGNVLLTSGIQFNNGFQQYVVCNDSSGNNLWTTRIQTDRSICEMVETQNHEFIVATGWDNPATGKLCPGIFKIDSTGNFQWAKIFVCDTNDIYALQLVRTTDHYNILLATEIVQHMLKAIIKFDDNGNIVWSRSGTSLPQETNFAAPVEAGAVLLMNIRNMAPGDILKMNASGYVTWSNTYAFASASTMMTGDAQLLPNGNYMMCTNPFPNQDTTEMLSLEINPQGSIISSHSFRFEGSWFTHKINFSASPAGDFIYNITNTNSTFAILKTDGNFNPIWMDKVSPVTGLGGADIEFFDNNHFISLADIGFGDFLTIQSDARPSSNFSCFVPFDSVSVAPEPAAQVTNSHALNGLSCVVINHNPVYTSLQTTPTDYCSLVNISEDARLSLSVFPNPAKDYLSIINSPAIHSISIFNLLGENVLAVPLPTANCLLPTDIDVSSLPPGLYFIQAVTEKGIATTKFIKALE